MRRDLQRHGYTILPDHPLPLVDSELRPFVETELGRGSTFSFNLPAWDPVPVGT